VEAKGGLFHEDLTLELSVTIIEAEPPYLVKGGFKFEAQRA